MEYWLTIVIFFSPARRQEAYWGCRQALLRRFQGGIDTLSLGGEPLPLQQSTEDTESILVAFDQLAAQIAHERQHEEVANRGREMEVVLERLIAMLRQPLVAIQSYVTLIKQAPEIPASGDTFDLVQKLQLK